MKNIKIKNNVKKDILKKISIIFVSLFLIVLIVVAVRTYKMKSSFETTTNEQISLAKQIISEELSKRGESINSYETEVGKKMRRKTVQVSLKKNEKNENSEFLQREIYIIDLIQKKVIMHSTTEFYEMHESKYFSSKRGGEERLSGRFLLNRN